MYSFDYINEKWFHGYHKRPIFVDKIETIQWKNNPFVIQKIFK